MQQMAQKRWGDESCLQAIAQLYQRDVKVWCMHATSEQDPAPTAIVPHGSRFACDVGTASDHRRNPIRLANCFQTCHYDAVDDAGVVGRLTSTPGVYEQERMACARHVFKFLPAHGIRARPGSRAHSLSLSGLRRWNRDGRAASRLAAPARPFLSVAPL